MAEKVNLSSLGRSEQSSFEIFSGNMGFTRSGKYTEVARLYASASKSVSGNT